MVDKVSNSNYKPLGRFEDAGKGKRGREYGEAHGFLSGWYFLLSNR